MLRGLCGLSLVGVVAVAALVAPSVAFACDHSGSAVSIYTNCPSTAGGKPTPKHSHKSTPSGSTQPNTQPTTPSAPSYYVPPVHVSRVTKHALAHSGKDKKVLKNLVSNPNFVESRRLRAKPPAEGGAALSATGATSLGSAFDLGSGPLIFFALLAATVLVLLATGGVRSWRNRHRA
jgi:hypothetical protein